MYWLRMPQRIQYKLWVPVGHCVVHAPLVTCKTLSDRSRTLNNGVVCALHSQPISSSSYQDAQQPANRPFTVVGRTAWNRMPEALRRSSSLAVFKRSLKTDLFIRPKRSIASSELWKYSTEQKRCSRVRL